MKRLLLAIPIALALVLGACSGGEEAVPTHTPQVAETPAPQAPEVPASEAAVLGEASPQESTDVSLRIKTNPINIMTSWLDFDITNHSGNEFAYGEQFTLYHLRDGSWVYVEMRPDAAWDDMGVLLMPYSVNSGSLEISRFYTGLEEGRYKVEKDIYTVEGEVELIAVEFTIDDFAKE